MAGYNDATMTLPVDTFGTDEDRERERRLAAVGQLSARVLHDVNNVLNSILVAAYLVEACAGDEQAVRDHAQRIARAVNNGAAKLGPLRQFMRRESLDDSEEAPVDLAKIVSDILEQSRALWESRNPAVGIALERHIERSAPVRGTASDLRAAVLNLLRRAVDAMPKGGTLHVSVSLRDGQAVLEVRDTGAVLTPEERARAFEPDFSAEDWRKALGLAEAAGIVQRHRGVAEIDSEPGRGTVVRLRIPLAKAEV
jgi:signal transduction histidine kinase